MKKAILYMFVLLASVCSCGNKDNKTVPDKVQIKDGNEYIRIAYLPILDALPFFVAQERGVFEKEGLKVKLIPFTSHMDVDTALIGGSVDGAFTDIVRTEYLIKRDTIKLYYLTSTELQWSLITNKSARLSKLEQFGDKMIATTRYSGTDYFTDIAFKNVKTSAPMFKVQINDIDIRYKMLINNEMDAEWLPEPLATQAVMAGNKHLLTSTKFNTKLGVMAFRNSTVAKNADAYKKLSAVYSTVCELINKEGTSAYTTEIEKYCKVDTAVINRIPKIQYAIASTPASELINKTKEYLK